MPNWALLLSRLVLGAAGSALMTWIGWKLGGRAWALIALVFSAPVIGVAIARPLVEFTHDVMSWIAGRPLSEWQGSYYEFGGVQVRVFEDDEGLCFVTADVARATGIPALPDELSEGRTVPGTRLKALSLEQIEAWLHAHRDHEARRFALWARREVFAPWERKREGGSGAR
ncbi:MAG: hypothetical protein ACXWGT_06905 [Usitatibacter sp.]